MKTKRDATPSTHQLALPMPAPDGYAHTKTPSTADARTWSVSAHMRVASLPFQCLLPNVAKTLEGTLPLRGTHWPKLRPVTLATHARQSSELNARGELKSEPSTCSCACESGEK
eukprot:555071-Pleurochrysis_carterae.AAC.1